VHGCNNASVRPLLLLPMLAVLLGACASAPPGETVPITRQLRQCLAAGWQRLVLPIAGLQRQALWKAPAGPAWSRGAIVVLHGGGGAHTNFCVANVPLIAAQVSFSERALAMGFAVFVLDSSDQVTDNEGRLCGKVWDDEVRARPNLDLPFIERIVVGEIPALRAPGSSTAVFLTGLSSGGFMTVRAATHLGARVTAFAPVAAGDPYGWIRDCTRRAGDRALVAGFGMDLETRSPIPRAGSCEAAQYPNERPWDGATAQAKPPFRIVHHAQDGIVDRSCVDKLRRQLQAHGYAEGAPPIRLDGGERRLGAHFWQLAYNEPLLDWFAALADAAARPPR
jgi:poly(3-hydroxybutyrate) depolymerase